MGNLKVAQEKYDESYSLIRAELEKRVRQVLKANPSLVSFDMSMGSWCFWDKKDNPIATTYGDQKYLAPVEEIIQEWDDVMKLTGDPMKISRKEVVDGLTKCRVCGCFINPKLGEFSPAETMDRAGTIDEPRAPGDYDNICDVDGYK